jgi:hypothetical protein
MQRFARGVALAVALSGCTVTAIQPVIGGPETPRLRGAIERRGVNIRLRLAGGPPAALLAWRVHDGTCSNLGARRPIAPEQPLLRLDPDGRGEARARLRAPTRGAAAVVARGPLPDTTVVFCASLPR